MFNYSRVHCLFRNTYIESNLDRQIDAGRSEVQDIKSQLQKLNRLVNVSQGFCNRKTHQVRLRNGANDDFTGLGMKESIRFQQMECLLCILPSISFFRSETRVR